MARREFLQREIALREEVERLQVQTGDAYESWGGLSRERNLRELERAKTELSQVAVGDDVKGEGIGWAPQENWKAGDRVRVDPTNRGDWRLGTITSVDTGGVHVDLDQPVRGVDNCYTTPRELERVPGNDAVTAPVNDAILAVPTGQGGDDRSADGND